MPLRPQQTLVEQVLQISPPRGHRYVDKLHVFTIRGHPRSRQVIEQGDLTAAITSFKKALDLRPSHSQAHYNVGNALKDSGELTDAIDSDTTALQIEPSYPAAIYNMALTMLLRSGYIDGWERYEWRAKKSE